MPNLMNRRKKKSSKVVDIVVNANSDSDSSCSGYDFSSKLNCKYNVLPSDVVDRSKVKVAYVKDDKEDTKSLRFEPPRSLVVSCMK